MGLREADVAHLYASFDLGRRRPSTLIKPASNNS